MKKNYSDLNILMINSIKANAISLLGQLEDYSFFKITKDQSKKLNEIEILFHNLVEEIINN